MSEDLLLVRFEVDPGANTAELSQAIARWLAEREEVAEVEAAPDRARALGPGEIAAIITAGVVVVKELATGFEELTRLLKAIKAFARELGVIKSVRIAGDGEGRDVSQVADDDLAQVAEEIARRAGA